MIKNYICGFWVIRYLVVHTYRSHARIDTHTYTYKHSRTPAKLFSEHYIRALHKLLTCLCVTAPVVTKWTWKTRRAPSPRDTGFARCTRELCGAVTSTTKPSLAVTQADSIYMQVYNRAGHSAHMGNITTPSNLAIGRENKNFDIARYKFFNCPLIV